MTKQEEARKRLEIQKKIQADLKKYPIFSFLDVPEDDVYEEDFYQVMLKKE